MAAVLLTDVGSTPRPDGRKKWPNFPIADRSLPEGGSRTIEIREPASTQLP